MRSDLIPGPRPSWPDQRQDRAPEPGPGGGAAAAVAPLLTHFFGGAPPVQVRFWDGTSLGPPDGDTLEVRSPDAVRRLLWAPGDLGLARAFVAGDLAFEGDIFAILASLHAASPPSVRTSSRLPWQALRAAQRLGALGRPLPPPPEEASPARPAALAWPRRAGGPAPLRRQQRLLFLGPRSRHDVLLRAVRSRCRHPRGRPGIEARPRLPEAGAGGPGGSAGPRCRLRVGCLGDPRRPAAMAHSVVGVTLSPAQAQWARDRVAAAGLAQQVEIRLQDYRDVRDGPFDAIASVGMFEHVGSSRSGEYFGIMRRLLRPEGRLLNHAISSVGGSRISPRFVHRALRLPGRRAVRRGAGRPGPRGCGLRGA